MQKGLTFIEILIALSIMTLLASFAAPNFNAFYVRHQTDSHARILLNMLNKTRAKAVLANSKTTFCGVDQTGECINGEARHFIVFTDENENRARDEFEEVFYSSEQEFEGKISLWASNQTFVTFQPSGTANQYGHIILCPATHLRTATRKISFNPGGRSYLIRRTPAKIAQMQAECEAL